MAKVTKEQRKYLNGFNGMKCAACDTNHGTCCEHVKTIGSGGPVVAGWNNMPICVKCHNLKGSKGISHMAENFPTYKKWLLDHGWIYCGFNKKWIYYEHK